MDTPRLYRTHPVHLFPWFALSEGYEALARELRQRLAQQIQPGVIVFDGYTGIEWGVFQRRLQMALAELDITPRWITTETCFLPAAEIEAQLATTLTPDPVFGRLFRGHLEELWDPARVAQVRQEIATRQQLTIVYGYGASLLAESGLTVYIDVPKDRAQQLAAQGVVCNVGANHPESFGLMYKRFYFVDWPMLNRVKRCVLPRLDLFVDASESTAPRFTDGKVFRRALHELAQRPFRVKPWFAPGPWGGQWMKNTFGLSPEQPNYAWSFELIAPENGILFGNGEHYVECAFDYLLWQETDAVLGPAVAARYGSYFPIRFDYLDTMDGTNLSCQVHPRVDYIRDEFGEPFTQDETYYIVTCKPDAQVFLGLREDADLQRFRADAEAARDQGKAFEITTHINGWPAHQHDLFLIPSGTVHCSGANNLVLEISATPYIYTFKIYDYLRSDLNGQLRHVHLHHAFPNIDPTRRTGWVQEHLLPTPGIVRQGDDWAEYMLDTTERLFFAIHRLEFTTQMEDTTEGKFLALNLVEGDCCELWSTGMSEPVELHFAESLVVPASVGRYTLRNMGSHACKVIKAFVK